VEALRLAVGLWTFQFDHGYAVEGRDWLARSLETPGAQDRTPLRALGLYAAGTFAFRALDQEQAQLYFGELLEIARSLGDDGLLGKAYGGLARVALRREDTDGVRRWSREGLALANARGKPEMTSTPIHMLAAAARLDADFEQARKFYAQNLELCRNLGRENWVGAELVNLGAIEVLDGHPDAAVPFLLESLQLVRRRKDRFLTPYVLAWSARVAMGRGDLGSAARLLGAAKHESDQTGLAMDPDEEPEFQKGLTLCKAAMTPADFDTAWQSGARLGFDEALDSGEKLL